MKAVTNIFDSPGGENHRFVIIPEDHERIGVVPICICTVDGDGNPVHPGWIEAVPPIADRLRNLARVVIQDVRRVSEVTEASVHSLSSRFGPNLGRNPSNRIWVDAKWRARDLAAGGSRARKKKEIHLRDEVKAILQEPFDFAKALENRDLVNHLFRRLHEEGYTEAVEMMQMYMSDSDDRIVWSDPAVAKIFGAHSKRERNTRSGQFWRWRKKASELLRGLHKERAA